MAGSIELAMNDKEVGQLGAISRSRTERASRVARAQMLLSYRETPSVFTVGRRLGVHQCKATATPGGRAFIDHWQAECSACRLQSWR